MKHEKSLNNVAAMIIQLRSRYGRSDTLLVTKDCDLHPLSSFIDWNRKRVGCMHQEKGVNEDVGDGVLNPLRGESFQFQVVLEAERPGTYTAARIGNCVKFVKYVLPRNSSQP